MKQAVFFFITFLLVGGCKKECTEPAPQNTVLILKVDYLTHQFEGAIEQVVSATYIDTGSIPLGVEFKSPLDFGHIKVWYEPSLDSLFSGTVIAIGEGALNYPFVQPGSHFTRLNNPLPMPDTNHFRHIIPGWYSQADDLDSLWMGIADLELVSNYYEKTEIAYFLYTPSVWIGDPATWDYYIFMNALK